MPLPLNYFLHRSRDRKIFRKALEDWNPYFQSLNPKQQEKFLGRCIRFYYHINWEKHPSLQLSRHAKIIISSAYIQITFGFYRYLLKHFRSIRIMPQSYTYFNNKAAFDGDVNLSEERITLSWPAVEKGFLIPDDSMNLCLHEFAHCLMLENRVSIFLPYFSKKAWEAYKIAAKRTFKKLKQGQSAFLRKYAGTNLMELFAVAIEAFFEEPQQFYQQEPQLFRSLANLLQQDPRKVK